MMANVADLFGLTDPLIDGYRMADRASFAEKQK
jgi:hypothetical protein